MQFMQIYIKGCYLYGFDKQKVFRARYIAGNPSISQEYRKYDGNNVELGNNATIKSWQEAKLPINSYR